MQAIVIPVFLKQQERSWRSIFLILNVTLSYFCSMETKRQLKIARLLQKDLGEIFQLELKHLVSGSLITVTKVNVSPDLSLAKVYLSIFGVKDKASVVNGIKPHMREIRYILGSRVRHQLRVIPELQFYLDDSLDYIEHIDNLLKGE